MQELERNRKINSVLTRILFLNWTVSLAKIILGLFSGSLSILADGFHSLLDGVSNIVGIIGTSISCKPKDCDHPYGHSKFEYIFAGAIAFLLLLIIYGLGHAVLERLLSPEKIVFGPLGFAIMLVTLIVNFIVQAYEKKKAKDLNSHILHSDSEHTKSDVLVTVSVILGMVGTEHGFPILDPIITLFVIVMIARSAYYILKPSFSVLVDTARVEPKKIEKIALNVKGVESVHNIRSRGSEDKIFLDFHMMVDKKMPIKKAHQLSHKLKSKIMSRIPGVNDIIIHIEPKQEKQSENKKKKKGS